MKLLNWICFTWDLRDLALGDFSLPEHYEIGRAQRDDEKAVRKVISSSFVLDPVWNGDIQEITQAVETWLDGAFEGDKSVCVVLRHGLRIIGAAVAALEPVSENHLAPGPCILMEYRNRGFGTHLLDHSLLTLRNAGCTRAMALAKETTPAAKFLYTKFDGVASPQNSPLLAA